MANTTLTQTGTQVQADLDKVEGMANIKSVGSGLSLSSAGQLSASGGSGGSGTQLYLHQISLIDNQYSGETCMLWVWSSIGTQFTSVSDMDYGVYIIKAQPPSFTSHESDYVPAFRYYGYGSFDLILVFLIPQNGNASWTIVSCNFDTIQFDLVTPL